MRWNRVARAVVDHPFARKRWEGQTRKMATQRLHKVGKEIETITNKHLHTLIMHDALPPSSDPYVRDCGKPRIRQRALFGALLDFLSSQKKQGDVKQN